MAAGSTDTASVLLVDAGAFLHNVGVFRGLADGAALCGVLKGNAYGHGLAETLACTHHLLDWICVITADEALRVRAWEVQAGRVARKLLVIGMISGEEAARLAHADVAVAAGGPEFADVLPALLASDAPPLRVHLHLDTGLSREGFLPGTLSETLGFLDDAGPRLVVEGVMTHFADTEDVTEQTQARLQLERFAAGVERLRETLAARGRSTTLLRHASASAAVMVLAAARLDLVRVGIGLYGFWPSRETRISAHLVLGAVPDLAPVLSWRCPVQLVKELPAGAYVGYGCTHRCRDATTIAVLPVGYWDGYPRLLSNRAHVLVHGRRCPVLGRVMMNHIIVDVTGVPGCASGSWATLIGADGGESLSAEHLAAWAQTIQYEIVTRLGAHLARRVIPLGDPHPVG